MKIGIFDSGIGGLSVLHEAYHILPIQEYYFYADVDNVPYGIKSESQILSYCRKAVRFFLEKEVDIILIACNTATSVAINVLRQECPVPLIGTEPAVKTAVSVTPKNRRILVIATPVTLREEKLKNLIERVDINNRVDLLPTPKLVTYAENEIFDSKEVEAYIREQLRNTDLASLGSIVLGCTHFNYFKPLFRQITGEEIRLIDGHDGTICHLADVAGIERRDLDSCSDIDNENYRFNSVEDMIDRSGTKYFLSGRQVDDQDMLAHFMRLQNRLEDVRNI